jgi:uncharacterized protein
VTTNELLEAILAGDEDRALEALRDHPELAVIRDPDGLSPLMQALYRGLGALATELRAASEELDIFESAAVGDIHRLGELVSDPSDANSWSSDGFTPLHLAAFFGQPEAARLLIGRGADLEAPARNRRFASQAHPLHSAVAAQDRAICSILLEAGADPNSKQHGGFTPLLEAAQLGSDALVAELLEHGADPRGTLDNGKTAAELARQAGNASLAERLEEARGRD